MRKRVRTIFTPEQLKRLEQEFSSQMYLVGDDRGYLASSLNLTEAQVKVWFQNRRIKHRKLNPGPSPKASPSSSSSQNTFSNAQPDFNNCNQMEQSDLVEPLTPLTPSPNQQPIQSAISASITNSTSTSTANTFPTTYPQIFGPDCAWMRNMLYQQGSYPF